MTQDYESQDTGSSTKRIVVLAIFASISFCALFTVVMMRMRDSSDTSVNTSVEVDSPEVQDDDPVLTDSDPKSRAVFERAEVALDNDDLDNARQLCVEAISLAKTNAQIDRVKVLLVEIDRRQLFISRRFKKIVQQAEQAFDNEKIEEAEILATRAGRMKLAPNYHLLRILLARIDAYNKGRKESSGGGGESWADIADRIRPSVVCIASHAAGKWSSGTGFVVDGNLIATNRHVIAEDDEFASQVHLRFEDGQTTHADSCVFVSREKDIAILTVKDMPASASSLKIAFDGVRPGTEVAAYGHPIGLDFTFTPGYVSSIRQGEDLGHFDGEGTFDGLWLQHTAPISGGNSGGPLLDKKGRVVAMNSWGFQDSKRGDVQNLNFAISAEDLTKAIDARRNEGAIVFRSSSATGQDQEENKVREIFGGLFAPSD